MSARVEEFYNRVHSPRDGKFSTSGTGGGHYKGRASGAKAPGHSKGGSGHHSTKIISSKTDKPTAKEYLASRVKVLEAQRAAGKKEYKAKTAAHDYVQGRVKVLEAQRAAGKAAHKQAAAATPPKASTKNADAGKRSGYANRRAQPNKTSSTGKPAVSARIGNFLSKANKALRAVNPNGGLRNPSSNASTLNTQRQAQRDAKRRRETEAYNRSRG